MKRQISVLDQSTIDKIAAGEVVERPASVVKELVENAIDAGASAVTVEIKGGGISFIRITDNGSGIARDQVPLAFLRHATSKIRQVEDLAFISSLGFRGEALSSIAAVSQVELITKPHEDLMGTRYVIEGGREQGLEDVGAPDGTTFLVRNLFYNTPARAKFLKTPATESGYISSFIEQLALSHPYISFKFIQDGKTKLHTSGNDNLREVIYQVYGREITRELIEIHDVSPDGEMEISGFIGKPTVNRGNRNFENYYVNGRYVKSKVLMKAIEDAYHTYTMQHKYPFTALVIQIRGDDVDINVHPTKMEVRFSRQEEVYRQVFQAIRQALQQKELIPEVSVSDDASKRSGQKEEPEKKAPRANGAEPFEIHRRQMEAAARGRNADPPFSRTSRTGGTDRMPAADLRSSRSDAAVPGSPLHTEMEKAPIVSGREPAAEGNIPTTDGANRMTVENTHAASAPNQAMLGNTQAALGLNQVPAGNAQQAAPAPTHAPTGIVQAAPAPNQAVPENTRTAPGINQAAAEKAPTAAEPIPAVETGGGPTQPETAGEGHALNRCMPPEKTEPVRQQTDTPQPQPEPSQPMLRETGSYQTASPKPREPEEKPVQMELFDGKLLSQEARSRHRIIGQVFDTYWLVQMEDKLYIIDQHAAHEKVLYERIVAQIKRREVTSQLMSPPLIISLNLQEQEKLKRYLDVFASLGFEIEAFGGNEYSIRSVPQNLYGLTRREMFTEILDHLDDNPSDTTLEVLSDRLATMACKAAVKGNTSLSAQEARALIDELLELENPYTCPHGRPTIISMSRYELEKKFKRIV